MKSALVVSNSAGLITSFLRNDIKILKEKGYYIECACNTFYDDTNTYDFFREFDIKVYHINFPIRKLNIKQIMESYIELGKILKRGEYKLVHCHSTIASAIVRQCTKKYRQREMKIVYTSHGFPFYKGNRSKKAKLFFSIEKYYSKYTDAIITICTEDYLNAKKMKCKNVFQMHGVGVNVDRFINVKVDRDEYRKQLGFLDTDKMVLSIGEINTNKNHKVVIRALGEIGDSDIVYVICGRELAEKGCKKSLENLAKQLNVRLVFLGYRKDIPEICHSVDIGVLPSYKEGLGLAGIEMLASGLPVVGSNRQGIKDYVKNGITGFLADPEDVHSFAESIKSAFRISNSATVRNNCKNASKDFDIKQAYDTILRVYNLLGI